MEHVLHQSWKRHVLTRHKRNWASQKAISLLLELESTFAIFPSHIHCTETLLRSTATVAIRNRMFGKLDT